MSLGTLITNAGVFTGVMYIATSVGLIPRKLCQAWCLVSGIFFVILARVACEACSFVGRYRGWSADYIGQTCNFSFCYSFALWMKVNGQVKVTMDEESKKIWDGIPKDKPSVLLMNHVSFADALLISYHAPMWYRMATRSLYMKKADTFPVIGKCFKMAEHFPVYFKVYEDGKFSVDTEKMAVVNDNVATYLKNNGHLVVYPEGALNKTPEEGMQAFRHGTFKMCFDAKADVHMLCAHGVHKMWSAKDAIGGFPASIKMSVVKLETRYDSETPEEMASRAQKQMWEEYQRLRELNEPKKSK